MPKHDIERDAAIALTKRHRDLNDIRELAEYFDRSAFEDLLADTRIKGIRIYLGREEAEGDRICMVMVGVKEEEGELIDELSKIKEMGEGCPDRCDYGSPLMKD